MDDEISKSCKKINDDERGIVINLTCNSVIKRDFRTKSFDNEEENSYLTERKNEDEQKEDENSKSNQESKEIDLSNVFYDLRSPKKAYAEKIRSEFSKMLSLSFLSTKLEDIGNISLNYQMYLSIIKRMCVLFFILGIFSIYPIYYNSQGSKLYVGDAYIEIDLWNLNNQNSPTNTDEYIEHERKIKNFIVFDFLTIMIYFFYLQYLANFIRKLQKNHSKRASKNDEYNKNTTDIEDFTIMVLGLPPDIKEEEIKEKFGTTNVLKVILVRKYDIGLKLYKEQHHIRKDLDYYKKLDEISNSNDLKKKLNTLNKQLTSVDEQINKFNNGRNGISIEEYFPVIRAFVVFSSRKVRNRIIKNYSPIINLLSILNIQSNNFSIQRNSDGKYQKINIKIIAADSPNSINWEQIKHHRSLIYRFLIFGFCFIFILFFSYEIVFVVKKYFSKILNNEKCSDIDESLPLDQAQEQYTTIFKRYCYCKNQLFIEMKNNSNLRNYCSDFIRDLSTTMAIRFGLGIIVWLVNFGMKKAVKILIGMVYNSGKNKGELLTVTCLFPLVLVNMGVVTIVLNVSEKVFTNKWYSSSGNTLVSAMILGIVTSHIEYIVYYISGYIKRNFCLKKFKSQGELNKRFKDREFELANRYALMLIVVCICYMHAGGLPLLNIICFISLFVQYWVDKWLMFSYNITPTVHNKFIGHRIILLLHFPLLIHCIEFYFIYHSALMNTQDMANNVKPQSSFKFLIGVNAFVLTISVLSLLKQFFKLKIHSCKKNEIVAVNDRNTNLELFLIEQAKKYDITENEIYSQLTRERGSHSVTKSDDYLFNRA